MSDYLFKMFLWSVKSLFDLFAILHVLSAQICASCLESLANLTV